MKAERGGGGGSAGESDESGGEDEQEEVTVDVPYQYEDYELVEKEVRAPRGTNCVPRTCILKMFGAVFFCVVSSVMEFVFTFRC